MNAETYVYRGSVIEVHDGDTLHLDVDLGRPVRWVDQTFGFHVYADGRRLRLHEDFRLAGINAPELANPDGSGLAARDYLIGLLEGDSGIFLTPLTIHTIKQAGHDRQEKYGRWLAILWLPGEDPVTSPSINQRMIDSGHAVSYSGGPRSFGAA